MVKAIFQQALSLNFLTQTFADQYSKWGVLRVGGAVKLKFKIPIQQVIQIGNENNKARKNRRV